MNGTLSPDEHVVTETGVLPDMVQKAQIPGLPMDGWPLCFGPPRKSADGKYYEVMPSVSTGEDNEQAIWKFHPPVQLPGITQKVGELKKIPPFLGNADLCDSLDDLEMYNTNMWIIEDGIKDKDNRRKIFREDNSVSLYCGSISKLRKSRMHDVTNGIFYINRELNKKLGFVIENPLNHLGASLGDTYEKMDYQTKVDFVKQIDTNILEYLESLYAKLKAS